MKKETKDKLNDFMDFIFLGIIIYLYLLITPLLERILTMKQTVCPIKDSNILQDMKYTLLHDFRWGRRNLAIFQVRQKQLFYA